MRTFEQAELDDIRGLYRDAKDKEAQIGVLCELYDTDRASIFAALGMQEKAEREEAAASARQKRKVRSYEQVVRDDVVRAVMLDGLTQREAAERYAIPQANISVWIKKAKARMAEFGVEPEAEEESEGSSQSPEETERAADEKKGDAAPAQPDDAARREEMLDFANRTLEELREGVDGLGSFICNFAGVDILSDDEWEILERIQITAGAFKDGVETGIAIWRDWP